MKQVHQNMYDAQKTQKLLIHVMSYLKNLQNQCYSNVIIMQSKIVVTCVFNAAYSEK